MVFNTVSDWITFQPLRFIPPLYSKVSLRVFEDEEFTALVMGVLLSTTMHANQILESLDKVFGSGAGNKLSPA